MPELPDITIYIEGLQERIVDTPLTRTEVFSPFLLRSFDPPLEDTHGKKVVAISRIGKRIVLEMEDDLFLVFHLMIAGRLQWKPPETVPKGKIRLAAFYFPSGTLILTEAGTKKRASLHVLRGAATLTEHDRGGLNVMSASEIEFADVLRSENHTLRRALVDPKLFSGIGNAYSDEILHAARLSPIALTSKLDDAEVLRLYRSTLGTLTKWTERLRIQFADRFPGPGDITAFRKDFAVHGRFGLPCPECETPVQRIRYATNETNYCPTCQTDGKVLADRSLSRLLKGDWPRTVDELEG